MFVAFIHLARRGTPAEEYCSGYDMDGSVTRKEVVTGARTSGSSFLFHLLNPTA